ncbi:hypothetical protein HPB49_009461 [Dermacentor silvarum]|uniref:Uncharacterized protein n=1 Tax=Dermacentor silvarum TaxID=543639 RepID=A0ACB8D4D2_DERSI|nr:hypothetical protein HPB49_009461 [Dermacentor silvarum]
MAPHKRRKAYLDPGSTATIPRATKWHLTRSADGSSQATRRRTANESNQRPASAHSPQLRCSNADNESLRKHCERSYDNLEVTDDSDHYFSDSSEGSERVTSPCGTSLFVQEDEGSSGNYDLPSDSFNVEDLTLPFIEGGRLTCGDAYMMLLDIAVKFGLSWTAIEEIQKLVNNLIEKKAFPESRYLFKKVCGVDMDDVVFHFYCSHCRLHLADTKGTLDERKRLQIVCDICHTQYTGSGLVRDGSFFISLPIKKQLTSILSSKTVGSAVMSSLTRKHQQ